ncbi:CpaE family protein [Egicoccus sp. AB-alg6-2]|uniref:AAA family ATPase n=1 Tax=Egicoccus sp. AB-alg6-2 TaxID=3242692 RepID=UPI00359E1A75
MTDLRILLATPEAGYEQRVRQAFRGMLNGDLRRWDGHLGAVTPDAVLGQLGDVQPDVVAIGPGLELDSALELAKRLEQDRPEISVLLITETTPTLWEQALRAGVRDVLAPDAVDADVRSAFDRALAVAEGRRRMLAPPPMEARGRIITVLSPKGGSGKTTLSTNLAVGLAMAQPGRVVIVDLDLQFGDVSSALRVTPESSIVDAVRTPGPLDVMTLKTLLTPHASSLWALCGPESPAEGEAVSAEQAKDVVEALAGEFDYVIVDTCAGITEHTLSVLEVSSDLVLMCAMDVLSVRSLRKEVDALEQLGMTQQKRHFVINRADSKVGLDIKDVEATVGLPVDVAVSSSRAVPLSMNQGSPVVESDPRSAVARQFTNLVNQFTDQPQRAGLSLLRRGGR